MNGLLIMMSSVTIGVCIGVLLSATMIKIKRPLTQNECLTVSIFALVLLQASLSIFIVA